jgi:hypothetical protein
VRSTFGGTFSLFMTIILFLINFLSISVAMIKFVYVMASSAVVIEKVY